VHNTPYEPQFLHDGFASSHWTGQTGYGGAASDRKPTFTLRSLQFLQPFLDFLWALRFRGPSISGGDCVLTTMAPSVPDSLVVLPIVVFVHEMKGVG
jgi:hypothetical protein